MKQKQISAISNKEISHGEAVRACDIREGIFRLIARDFPQLDRDGYLSIEELNRYRRLYLTSLIVQEKGELAIIDRDVMDAIQNNSILSENIQDDANSERTTLGQRIADRVAAFGGSWIFIITFFHSYSSG